VIPEIKIIEQLREELADKKEEIGILNDRIAALESRMKETHAEMERLQMENRMHIDELKKDFDAMSEKQLAEFKRYYEDKLQRI
jgi:chromosome segregation ATPase